MPGHDTPCESLLDTRKLWLTLFMILATLMCVFAAMSGVATARATTALDEQKQAEVDNAAVQQDLRWIKSTLVEIKDDLRNERERDRGN